MIDWSLSDVILAFTLACLALLPVLWAIHWFAEWRVKRDDEYAPDD